MLRFRYLLLIALAILFFDSSFAATFTVTSNADTGPGTLREALTLASQNGTTEQDIIRFNLPGTLSSDRTIRLKTQLPYVSSNVMIDGTTQPGNPFGVSDAHVIIEPESRPSYFNGLVIGDLYTNNAQPAESIEIYGLYIRNFAQITSFSNYNQSQGAGIYLYNNTSKIIIGAPGKGNVISGNIYGICSYLYNYNSNNTNDIIIQSNLIGINDDGTTLNSNVWGINIQVNKKITIGGDAANQGNTISGNLNNIVLSYYYYYGNINVSAIIKNNKIGTDYTGTKDYKQAPIFSSTAFLNTYGIYISNGYNINIDIINNIISGQRSYGIWIDNVDYNIKGNKIGTDITGTQDLGNAEGIRIGNNSRGNIGGPAASDKNYIGYNKYGIEVQNSPQTLITQNSIFCNTDYGISVPDNYPFVQVLKYTGSEVSGMATPNTKVELFYTDDCSNTCQGKEYITSVQADGSGKWTYTGTISHVIVATATDANNRTSAFSSLELRNGEATVKHFTCAYAGSITISPAREGIEFHWDKKEDNGTLTALSDDQNISNLQPGTYVLTIKYPGGCQKTTREFPINDNRIKINQLIPPVPQCRQKIFPVDAYYQGGTGNIRFEWIDQNGIVRGTGKQAYVPAGTYKLRISDDAGCSETSTEVIPITAKPGPDYDLTTAQIKPAQCGVPDGYIKNITYFPSGIGTLKYFWKDMAGNPVGDLTGASPDLINVKGGYYTVTLVDDSECSPYSTPIYSLYVPETNSVFIYSTHLPSPAMCGNDGSITGIYVQNANKFEWYGPNGILIPNNNQPDIYGLTDGTYKLVATNTTTGCNNSAYYTVGRIYPTVFNFSGNKVDATCDQNNGSISLTFYGTEPSSIVWKNGSGATVGSGKNLTGLPEGNYSVYTTDIRNCQPALLANYTINRIAALKFAPNNNPTAVNDQCDLQTGSVHGISVKDGIPPYRYTWRNDATQRIVGTNSPILGSVGKGTYTLTVEDGTSCPITYANISVGNDVIPLAKPEIKDVRICSPEMVNLVVENSQSGTYCVYKNLNDIYPVLTSDNDRITFKVTESSDYYISLKFGTCESPRTKVHVEVILVDIEMANTFTPNSDGINDYWQIKGLQKFPGSTVQIFDRYGRKVFESRNYTKPFDGTMNGKQLPVGEYYYIIDLKTSCNLISGNLTMIR